jgi:hypothetical protein
MRERLAGFATVSTLVLALALCPNTWAQQQNRRAATGENQNPTAGQDRTQNASAMETIRGVIAAITAEGEVMFDYRTNGAVRAEAAFLTVVGSPSKAWADDAAGRRTSAAGTEDAAARRTSGAATERDGSSNKKRHNVYIVWLTPRTKICEATGEPGKSNQNADQTRTDGQKEIALDQLEVGDHVEIQFNRGDNSTATNAVHQTEQMRQKHGRQRTFVGFANAITIVPGKDHDQSSSAGERSNERERSK